jgi:hypothetical protein
VDITVSIFRVKVSGVGKKPGNASMEIWMWILRNKWACKEKF